MPDLETLEMKASAAHQEVRNLIVMQLRPGQSPEKLALLQLLEPSARAEARLRDAALERVAPSSCLTHSNPVSDARPEHIRGAFLAEGMAAPYY
jgi:hypothetical protein